MKSKHLASMRPQHITAENSAADTAAVERPDASMRPQHITAENRLDRGDDRCGQPSFNEAAAYHCGKLALLLYADQGATPLQ